ncbi:putative formate transporter 1 [Sodalis glossinidius str. 'morsitans']|uniref:Formate/nitrite transport protein n=1 Tax=Sodalis glossinidius (strain morsitans) TaxID=343509 RepID=Q2NRG5_SODGM|nr:formate/nitrite transporter family protein [Sodalis glossinidius]BAE75260.1 formate/nitrite transport protein [Sodalis glossinidius str. 'morsitans']CRL46261.1 putative formate transporter 1 [Sodalis glossinidius str. 'morsitans']
MSFYSPKEVAAIAMHTGVTKSQASLPVLVVLGIMAGAFIALGFLLDIHVVSSMPPAWGSFGVFLGASVFPVGLVLTVLAGGELLTGNMMTLPMALFSRQIGVLALIRNWFWVTLANFIGSLMIAWFFGHILGMTEGAFLAKTVAIANAKISADFTHAFISAIGCNWLVSLAVWLAYAAKDMAGKILGIWFPIMAFVDLGFQHVVANMFVIPAAIFAGQATWHDYFINFPPVFLGNAVGGGIFVALIYFIAYRPLGGKSHA